MPRQMSGRWSLKHAMPSRAKSLEVETAQMRDLFLNGSFGRDTTIASFLSHRIRLLSPQLRTNFAILYAINPAFVGHFGNKIEAKLFAYDTSEEAAH
jgi:hypothetical protein